MGIIRHRRPITFEPFIRSTSQQQGIGSTQPFGIIRIEAFIHGVSLSAIIEEGHDIFARPLVVAIQRGDVTNNEFTH